MSPHLEREYEAIARCELAPLFRLRFPLSLASKANARGHTKFAAETNKKQRGLGILIGRTLLQGSRLKIAELDAERWFATVRLVRVSPRLLDNDNLSSCFKSVRDGIADAFGIDDRDPRVRYVPDQTKGPEALEVYLYG